jgi:hypothetical protein
MIEPGSRAGVIITSLAALVVCGIAALAWFGYRATDEWQRSSALLVERRSQQAADLLTLALTRDMRGVQTSVLMSEVENRHVFEPPYDINDLVAVAFARYPYPESLLRLAWGPGGARVVQPDRPAPLVAASRRHDDPIRSRWRTTRRTPISCAAGSRPTCAHAAGTRSSK